ncbi:MAG TPA: signal peptide peptidase SppA [Syntrophobacteria bacterium]|nr:signal peptide peptidase SppA [Syntrophobacteria bacterium]
MRKRSVLVAVIVLVLLFAALVGSIAFMSYRKAGGPGPVFGDKVGLLEVRGMIIDVQPVIEQLVKFKKDDSVKAIVFRIESPGGGVSPSQELYREIQRTAEKKPVVASMGSVAASGGYYIASGVQKIYANPGTITGSIGVIAQFTNFEELFKKIGFRMEVVKSGAFKDVGNPGRAMTPEEREYLQKLLDSVHQQFIRDVARGRRMPEEKVREIADGRIFTGEQAKEMGLVDELGGLNDAVDAAAKMANITGEPKLVYPEKKKISFLDYLLDRSAETVADRLKESLELLLLRSLPRDAAIPQELTTLTAR